MGHCRVVSTILKNALCMCEFYTYTYVHMNVCRQQIILFYRISDKLIDELIMEISKELQIDDVIQKLFELEFQEF